MERAERKRGEKLK